MTRAATARSTRKRFIEASTGGAKSDRVAGVLSQREVPRKDPAAPRLFRPRGSRLHEGRVVLAGRLTGPRSSWDTLAVPARAKPTESSPVPLDAIDETNRVADQPGADVIDGRGKAVFPGLSNCHTHLHLTHSRGIQEDFGFPSSLRFPSTVAAFMSQEELGVFAALGAIEAIRSGTTGLIEIGFDVPSYAAVIARSGLR